MVGAPTPAFQSVRTRIAVLSCFWLAIVLSIPSWIRLTTIERLPLPTHQVESMQASDQCPVTFAARLTILVDPSLLPTSDRPMAEGDATSFLEQVEQLVRQSLELKAELTAASSLECTTWVVHALPLDAGPQERAGEYVIRVLDQADQTPGTHGTPGTHVSSVGLAHEAALPLVPDAVSAAVVAELLALRGDEAGFGAEGEDVGGDAQQDPRVIQYSKHIRLVFSIMNQDASDTTAYDSALIHALADPLAAASNPIGQLQAELSGLHRFHVETQVQWFAPLPFAPTHEMLEEIVESRVQRTVMVDQEVDDDVEFPLPSDSTASSDVSDGEAGGAGEEREVEVELGVEGAGRRKKVVQVPKVEWVVEETRRALPARHVVEWDDLKVFVNSEEWALTSTVPPSRAVAREDFAEARSFDMLSHTHDLHLLLYIPSRSSTPLHIRDASGMLSSDRAWLVPQWGGVVILNAPHSSNTSSDLDFGDVGKVRQLPQEDVVEAIGIFARQLEMLLGLRRAGSKQAREVALEVLKQRRAVELAREAKSTLRAIVRLVRRIDNLGVGRDVQTDTQAALRILESLPTPLIDLDAALIQLQRAAALANRAFFNPAMLGLLYFPDEHKYAVYTPLFAPLLVPLVVTTLKLIRLILSPHPGRKTSRKSRPSLVH